MTETRYAELARTLMGEIASGAYPVGSILPSENELADVHGVSRSTVRMALDRLRDLGLITRRKRAGTRVEALTPPAAHYGPTISSVEELIQYSADSRREIHSVRHIVVDVALSGQLGCEPGTKWMHIQASRSDARTPGYPLAWWHVYVTRSDGLLIRPHLKTSQDLVCDLIYRASGRVVSEVRQTVQAVGVPAELSATLGAEPGSHALQFTRRYYDQMNELFQVAVSLHPADRFSYSTVLRRQVT